MLEKIKELRVKAECAKALLALADDESEKRHFSKLLDKYKTEQIRAKRAEKTRRNFGR